MPFVNIRILKGHSKQRKDEISRRVTETISEVAQLPKEAIWVVFEDVDSDDWYVGGDSVTDIKAAKRKPRSDAAMTASSGVEIRDPQFAAVVGETVTFEQIGTRLPLHRGPALERARTVPCCSATCRAIRSGAGPRRAASKLFASRRICRTVSPGIAKVGCWPASMRPAGSPGPRRDGSLTVIASHLDGKELNSPNDIVVRSDGGIYFSDPIFGAGRVLRPEAGSGAELPRRLSGRAGRQETSPCSPMISDNRTASLLLRRRKAALRQTTPSASMSASSM